MSSLDLDTTLEWGVPCDVPGCHSVFPLFDFVLSGVRPPEAREKAFSGGFDAHTGTYCTSSSFSTLVDLVQGRGGTRSPTATLGVRGHGVRIKERSFGDYEKEGHLWITLSTGEYYPDILPLACELYKPVLITFGQLVRTSHSSKDLFMAISQVPQRWMRVQLCRVFRKYVSPDTSVEMLKKKGAASEICENFGERFRLISEVQRRFSERPMPDEALCAVLWGYKDRGQKGYDLTERLFAIIREKFPGLSIIGPERAGKDVLLGEIFKSYPKPDSPVDFVILEGDTPLAIGLARYDSDRGGAQEDDRTGQYRDCASEFLKYTAKRGLPTKVIFLNDGPGLLLGSMWKDYAYLENRWRGRVRVVTLRMFPERLSLDWLRGKK